MHQLCFLYMLNYPAVYSLLEREIAAAHMNGIVFTLARFFFFTIKKFILNSLEANMKINNTTTNDIIKGLLLHDICE